MSSSKNIGGKDRGVGIKREKYNSMTIIFWQLPLNYNNFDIPCLYLNILSGSYFCLIATNLLLFL